MSNLGYNFSGNWGIPEDRPHRPVQPLLIRETLPVALLCAPSLYQGKVRDEGENSDDQRVPQEVTT